MSPALHVTHLQTLNTAHSLPVLARWSVAFAVTVTKWDANYRTRKHLKRVDRHILRDIGLDRSDVDAETAKSFWQD